MNRSGRIQNREFYELLRRHKHASGRVFTVELLAEGIGSGRAHVNQVLLNAPGDKGQRYGVGRGGRTRKKLVAYFQTHFPGDARAMLAALGWDEHGQIVPRGEIHVEHPKP